MEIELIVIVIVALSSIFFSIYSLVLHDRNKLLQKRNTDLNLKVNQVYRRADIYYRQIALVLNRAGYNTGVYGVEALHGPEERRKVTDVKEFIELLESIDIDPKDRPEGISFPFRKALKASSINGDSLVFIPSSDKHVLINISCEDQEALHQFIKKYLKLDLTFPN